MKRGRGRGEGMDENDEGRDEKKTRGKRMITGWEEGMKRIGEEGTTRRDEGKG